HPVRVDAVQLIQQEAAGYADRDVLVALEVEAAGLAHVDHYQRSRRTSPQARFAIEREAPAVIVVHIDVIDSIPAHARGRTIQPDRVRLHLGDDELADIPDQRANREWATAGPGNIEIGHAGGIDLVLLVLGQSRAVEPQRREGRSTGH